MSKAGIMVCFTQINYNLQTRFVLGLLIMVYLSKTNHDPQFGHNAKLGITGLVLHAIRVEQFGSDWCAPSKPHKLWLMHELQYSGFLGFQTGVIPFHRDARG